MTVLQSSGSEGGQQTSPVPAAASAGADQLSADQLHSLVEGEVHAAFEAEMSAAKQTVREAVEQALEESSRNGGLTANVNTLMAVTGVIMYWRGVDGLLGILLEDSFEGYVACTVLGFTIGTIIRQLKLPVVEGGGMGPF